LRSSLDDTERRLLGGVQYSRLREGIACGRDDFRCIEWAYTHRLQQSPLRLKRGRAQRPGRRYSVCASIAKAVRFFTPNFWYISCR